MALHFHTAVDSEQLDRGVVDACLFVVDELLDLWVVLVLDRVCRLFMAVDIEDLYCLLALPVCVQCRDALLNL